MSNQCTISSHAGFWFVLFRVNRRFARERRAEDDGSDVEDVRETRGVESDGDGACATRRVNAMSEREEWTRRVIGLERVRSATLLSFVRQRTRARDGRETMMNARR